MMDLIDRQSAIDAIQERINQVGYTHNKSVLSIMQAVMELPSAELEWNNHTVACLLADLFGDSCACNYCGIDEWLPESCWCCMLGAIFDTQKGEPMSDSIVYRKDVVEVLYQALRTQLQGTFTDSMSLAISMAKALPSAEPKIIHCGDCKYKDDGIDEDGIPFLKCLNGRSYGGTRINDYCSWAERRTDEDN